MNLDSTCIYQVLIHLAHTWKAWDGMAHLLQRQTPNNSYRRAMDELSAVMTTEGGANQFVGTLFDDPLRPARFISLEMDVCSNSCHWCRHSAELDVSSFCRCSRVAHRSYLRDGEHYLGKSKPVGGRRCLRPILLQYALAFGPCNDGVCRHSTYSY
jgi:hypothetical protein